MKQQIVFTTAMAVISVLVFCFLLLIYTTIGFTAWLVSFGLVIPCTLVLVPQIKKIIDKYL